MPIKSTVDEGIAVVRMEEPRGNALGSSCIRALHACFDELERAGVRAAVLTGKGGVFSVGLDLVEAWDFDRAQMARYVEVFDELFLRAFSLPFPTVAAVNGHAIAGGCILALCCDAQLVADGAYGIGINEVLLGIPFPSGAFEIARYGVPPSSWNEAFLEGRRFTPDEARQAGIVEAVVPMGTDVVEAARAKAVAMSRGGAEALRLTKLDLKERAIERARRRAAETRARFLDAWFAGEARARVDEVRERLLAREG